ncbi:MAG TPA: FAD-dependent monooxygenase [Streptosporangiaceae bacterium]|nr:FAD-dependent monooxygenase [Streptosporangiaceae bacterium]
MTSPDGEPVPVLIVGAGPAGLAAAIDLAAHDLEPLVLERRPDFSSHPRATALTAETMQLMSRWGIEAQVRASGFGARHAMSVRATLAGPEITRIPMDAHVWTCAQDQLEAVLAARAAAAGARLRHGSELADLRPAGDAILATIAITGRGSDTIRARYVLGADGAHSRVRQAAGITRTKTRSFGDYISILFRAPLRDYTGEPPFMVYGIGNPATGGVLVPAGPDDRWIRGLPWHPGQGDHLTDYDTTRCTALIRSAAGIPALPVDVLDVRAFQMTAALADRYRAGRVILAGDAAHVFTPASGMGLNLALHDGTVAAHCLTAAIQHGQDEILTQYEAACRPLAEKLLEPELTPAAPVHRVVRQP